MQRIIFIPLDERPCNLQYPAYIGAISGLDIVFPPRELLGDFKKAADVDGLWVWIKSQAAEATQIVLSVDMFLYGGIVPSRLHHLTDETCRVRLARLRQLRRDFPTLRIQAYSLITRAPARNGAGEEPDYYEDYGYRIFRCGVIQDRATVGAATPEELTEWEQIKAEIPAAYLQDFLARRAQNFSNNMALIDLVKDGIIDFLLFPLDDCREYGFAPAERRKLAAHLARQNLLSRVMLYPGADEIGCTLLARAIHEDSGTAPLVYVDWSSVQGRSQIPSYEDRSIGETVQFHLLAAGCQPAETSTEADFILAVNPPTPFTLRQEKELITDDILLDSERNLPAFMARIKRYLARGQRVGVADCAIPNGADRALMQFLYEGGLLDKLTAYGGWNTSSNTLGTVLAHLSACRAAERSGAFTGTAQEQADAFLFLRYLEDWGYMACVRRGVTALLPSLRPDMDFLHLRGQQALVQPIVKERLEVWRQKYMPDAAYDFSLTFPWDRMFEIEVNLKKRQPSANLS